ncbi:hypothetical protein JVU11DRAFT_4104 [Chiua virens]|nr:hypothetical protein JVU11DRAFT_4104 [Chiua virens]
MDVSASPSWLKLVQDLISCIHNLYTSIMFSYSLVTLLGLAVSLPVSTSLAAYLDVTAPKVDDRWYAGKKYQVTWDTSNPPNPVNAPYGAIYVVDSGVIQYDLELASNVKLADGHVWVEAPSVETKPYQLALVGESTGYSPVFAIIGIPE